MPAYKEKNNKSWYVSVRYKDWTGQATRKVKRGFETKKEALEWERKFLLKENASLDMTFDSFLELYKEDMREKLKLNTWIMKESIIDQKILPYFKDKRMCEIKTSDIIAWQKRMMSYRDENGKGYSPTYLKTIHNQLSAIFNHAVRYYDLSGNPAAKAGNMGKKKTKEMLFWTKEEYLIFAESVMDKSISYYAFEMLYWCGLRIGELLALTPADFNFNEGMVRITKSFQRIKGEDIITDPKTEKSIRNIKMPDFLVDEMKDYISSFYHIENDTRIFPITKSYMHHEMKRGCSVANAITFKDGLVLSSIAFATAHGNLVRETIPKTLLKLGGDKNQKS